MASAMTLSSQPARALTDCGDLPSHAELQAALQASVSSVNVLGAGTGGSLDGTNGGFDLDMWATLVNRDGEVCAVAFSGTNRGAQWPGSRVISAQKANTANAFSLGGFAISTANLWAATQPGGSLFGLQHSNPVDSAVAYGAGPAHAGAAAEDYGQTEDPMVEEVVGGVNVFGGGLALYDSSGMLLGALGVSGDTSCADHNIAWRTRDTLGLDHVPGGPGGAFGGTVGDNMIFDLTDHPISSPESPSGFGHPRCSGPAGNVDDAVDNSNVVSACPLGDGTTEDCVD